MFDFLQQSSSAAATSITAATPSTSLPSTPDVSALLTSSPAERDAARAALVERIALRERAIRKDAEVKRRQGLDEFARLRTPPKPDPVVVEPKVSLPAKPVTYATPAPSPPKEPPSAVDRPAIADLSGAFQSVVDAAEATVQSAAEIIESFTNEKDGKDIDDEKLESEVEAFMEQLVDDFKGRVEDVKEHDEDIVEDTKKGAEDVVEDVKEIAEDVVQGMANEQAVKEGAEVEKSIAEKLLEAIVEGVETPEPAAPEVDKTDVIELVDTGKIKKLTVTKLKRLLSASGLKTSGRKAELIARLTSYANAK